MSGPPHTPDGRYFVIVGTRGPRLWRATNPALGNEQRAALTRELMSARRAVPDAGTDAEMKAARARVQAAKVALGERGPVWWTDDAPDLDRRLIRGTVYAGWWENLRAESGVKFT